jgi:hypothetical protein
VTTGNHKVHQRVSSPYSPQYTDLSVCLPQKEQLDLNFKFLLIILGLMTLDCLWVLKGSKRGGGKEMSPK